MTDVRPRKRSLTLHGHRTSVSLEEAFWTAFVDMARAKGLSINALAAQIDRDRGVSAGLASAIRVAVLRDLQQMADDPRRDDGDRSGR
ncbi:ribbon-helix-helix domain-containing protein [Jannaschia helgolandensis]|jgi:predicted DNA-binding ribbon-helix-helix protein|uniref:ribbon-helix-helix domain-containing protein n=1 Tax=Jannaschia helgolandensis TaxID=188906 RepID=UPI0030D7916B|tara:strand:- start:766 stop:1029 length:264 start_codon:yes stop_codon:yes gene_type:complete